MGSDRTESGSWIDHEIDASEFGDARLAERFRKLMGCFDGAIGQPIPLACEDWANTKAAYRFLSNASVSEEQILRWKIELFFKILKSGCNAEKLKLRTAERLVNLIAIYSALNLAGWP